MLGRAALAAGLLADGGAQAGAWTRDPGTWFVSGSTSYYATDDGDFEQVSASLYAEYGWTGGLTLAAALESNAPVGVAREAASDASLSLWGRARLWTGAQGDPLSAQLGAILPLGDVAATGQQQIDGETAVDGRLLYGRGFATDWGDAFIDAQAGLRLRLDDAADEVRIDLTAGLRPAPRWIVLVQSFSTIGLRNPEAGGQDFDVHKLAPAAGYEITPGVTLLLGAEREIAGRDIDRGLRLRAALWTTF